MVKTKSFNQFSLELEEYCGHMVKKSFPMVIVSWPKFKPDSTQVGPDSKGRLVPTGIVSLGRWGILV